MIQFILAALALIGASFANAQTLSPQELERRAIERRAVEAVIWGMPAVNYDLMLQEMLSKTPGKVNQVIYWGRPLDWRNQTLTPNPDTLYFMAFLNTKEVGPIVIEVPPAGDDGSMNANFVNVWQIPTGGCRLARCGQGRGREVADAAARLFGESCERLCAAAARHMGQLRADARRTCAAIAMPTLPESVAYGKRVKIYPLSQAAAPPSTTVFTDVQGRRVRLHHPLR